MVQRSTGCSLCVKRRVKCDERRPGCLKCETYGTSCPGYNRNFKFVTAKPHRSRRQPKVPSPEDEQVRAQSSPVIDYENAALEQIFTPQPLGVTALNVTQCLDRLTDEISQPFPSNSGYVISRWFLLLPGSYGRNKTLDFAMKAFTAHHVGSMTMNKQAVRYARSAYLEALSRLRKSLNNPTEALSSEVNCCVLLLCIYELFADTHRGDVWMSHAKGLTQLTKARGLSRYKTEFDGILLKASRGLIVMYSLFGGEECLLASDDWLRVMRGQNNSDLSVDFDDLVEEFFAHFTLCPGLIHKLYKLKEADFTDPATLVEMSDLQNKTLDLQEKLILWYDRFKYTTPVPRDVLSSTADAMYPTVLWYYDINSATIYCGYYSYMVLVHEILRTSGYPGDHGAMAAYFRDQICKSVQYTAQGFLGPYRMGFPLRVAWEVASPAVKEWITGCTKKFSKFYAVLRAENF